MPTWVPMFPTWALAAAGAGLLSAIVLLYFLKLKRQPVEVPSTYLWTKSIEDLHVNSIWQRLRQSLLLFLQLLLILLALFALFRPTWNTVKRLQNRVVFLIDASASMSATDVQPTRLEEAKRRVLEEIEKFDSNVVGMVVSFSDAARVEQQFTDNKKLLRRAVANIRQTNRTTNMKEALQVAAGLANPGRSADAASVVDTQVAEAMPAELKIYSDGGLDRVEGFSLGNLEPEFIQLGEVTYKNPDVPLPASPDEQASYLAKRGPPIDWAANVGIAAFSARRKEGRSNQVEAFARLENYGPDEVTTEAEIYLNKELIDARKVDIPVGESTGMAFDLGVVESGALELRLKTGDALKADDVAWATINVPRRSKVLLLTEGNEPLDFALSTERASQIADITIETPGFLETPEYKDRAAAGGWALVIFDRCAPQDAKNLPLANTLFIGTLPPGEVWKAEAKANVPYITETDRSHPLMSLLELGNVIILEGTPIKTPPGGKVLIDTLAGPLFVIAPRDAYEDAVLGFELVGKELSTNWPLQLSFPIFVLNVLEYLGGARDAVSGTIRPGQNVALQPDQPLSALYVRTPEGRSIKVSRGQLNAFNFSDTDDLGVYDVQDGRSQTIQRFAVNLFHPPESDIKPKDIQIGHTQVVGKRTTEPARRDIWKPVLLLALAVLLFEWYIYNRRVYL